MRIFIAGAGIAGLGTAAALADAGHDVTVLERMTEDHALGSGITLIAPAIRALVKLGVYDECVQGGFGVTQFQENDWRGRETRVVDLPSATGEGGPGILGMMRPELHRVLTARAADGGAHIEWGQEVTAVSDGADGVTVTLADGSTRRGDLLIGADGLRSTIRRLVFGEFPVQFQNQGCFRAVVARPPQITKETDFGGYPGVHPGFTPISEDLMYIYCTAAAADTSLIPQDQIAVRMRALLDPFGGILAHVRNFIDTELVNYRPFETILVPPPWNKGHVVLLGDAVHSTTPHLAAGGAMCLEDALVLAEELDRGGDLSAALDRFTDRRYARTKFVVDTSVKLAQWQLDGAAPDRDPSGLKIKARHLLAGAY
jgi:2-polyprenyl-6-methoxyphenol hydroxylase-like FAD-dependent oxidoreductase